MTKKALKMALEALEPFKKMFQEVEGRHVGSITETNIHCQISVSDLRKCLYAYGDIKEALANHIPDTTKMVAQPQPEPLAWEIFGKLLALREVIGFVDTLMRDEENNLQQFANTTKPQHKPMTPERINLLWYEVKGLSEPFARAIEAAHGIKGDA